MTIKKIEDLTFYELLEISPTASTQEIHRAYERIRRVYDPNSIALYSLFSTEETAAIHQRIEDAYRTLMYEGNRKRYDSELRTRQLLPPLPDTLSRRPAPASFPAAHSRKPSDELPDIPSPKEQEAPEPSIQVIQPPPPFEAEFTGPAIKLLREQRNFSIKHIAERTKIGSRYIELIEAEDFPKLPARPYLRGFLVLYAKALGYDPDRLASDYLKRYDAGLNSPKK